MKIRPLPALVLGIALIAPGSAAAQQKYPAKSVRIVLPFAAGSAVDVLARLYAQRMSESWGQQVVVDNRTGANGIIGMELIARAAPDGYTIGMANIATLAVNPSLYPKISYDSLRDFVPVSLTATIGNCLVVHPSFPVKSVPDLVALGEKASGPAQLRLGRHRQRAAHPDGTPGGDDRHQARAHRLQGSHAGVQRRARGAGADGVHRSCAVHSISSQRPLAHARHHRHQAHAGNQRCPDHRRAGSARLRSRFVDRRSRAQRHASRHRRADPRRGRAHHQAARHARAPHRRGLRTRRQFARGIRGAHQKRQRGWARSYATRGSAPTERGRPHP